MKRSKKFKLDKEAINKIDSEYDDRDLSNYTNYEVYEEEKPRHRFLKKLVKRLIILCAVVLVINLRCFCIQADCGSMSRKSVTIQ